jgi:hypothetical protein
LVFLKFCNRVKKIFNTFTDNGFLKNVFYYNIWVEFSEIVPKTISIIGLILFNMKIIDYDVSKRIPPINESLQSKMIISYSIAIGGSEFINYIIKDNDNMYKFRGGMRNHEKTIWTNSITWSDDYNKGNTIIELLISEYKWMISKNWLLSQYVIESHDNLTRIIEFFEITGDLKNELIACWEKCDQKL